MDDGFWLSGGGLAAVLAIIVGGIISVVFLVMLGAAEWNKHNAPIAFAQCAKLCGPNGVHEATPDFKCECNETKRIEGHPSIDLNLRQGNQ